MNNPMKSTASHANDQINRARLELFLMVFVRTEGKQPRRRKA